jgi:hypothetical protein
LWWNVVSDIGYEVICILWPRGEQSAYCTTGAQVVYWIYWCLAATLRKTFGNRLVRSRIFGCSVTLARKGYQHGAKEQCHIVAVHSRHRKAPRSHCGRSSIVSVHGKW